MSLVSTTESLQSGAERSGCILAERFSSVELASCVKIPSGRCVSLPRSWLGNATTNLEEARMCCHCKCDGKTLVQMGSFKSDLKNPEWKSWEKSSWLLYSFLTCIPKKVKTTYLISLAPKLLKIPINRPWALWWWNTVIRIWLRV